MKKGDMLTETVADSDVMGGSNRIVDLIAKLQEKLECIPEEFRSVAVLEIEAYDWFGSRITYERPVTDEEIKARLDEIDRQRARASKALQDREIESWIRNIRLGAGIMDRDEAREFLETNPEANNYHPDLYRTGRHGHA